MASVESIPYLIFCAWEIIFPFEDHYKTILFWLLASYRDFSSDRYFPRKLFLLSSIFRLPQKKACLWQPVWVDHSLCIWTFTLFVIVFPMWPGVRIFVCSVFSWFVSSLWFVKFDFLFYCMVFSISSYVLIIILVVSCNLGFCLFLRHYIWSYLNCVWLNLQVQSAGPSKTLPIAPFLLCVCRASSILSRYVLLTF